MEIQKSIRPPHGISAYTSSSMTVDGKCYTQSLLLGHHILQSPFGDLAMSFEIWDNLSLDGIEIVIIGIEGGVAQLPIAWRTYFAKRKIGLEVMGIGPACRTFNILLEEARQVLGWFILNA
jgi:uncharacterized protein